MTASIRQESSQEGQPGIYKRFPDDTGEANSEKHFQVEVNGTLETLRSLFLNFRDAGHCEVTTIDQFSIFPCRRTIRSRSNVGKQV